jgi:hypothetical protein
MTSFSFEADEDPALEVLCRDVIGHRQAGRVHVAFRRLLNAEGASAQAIASALVKGLGMTPPSSWTDLDGRQALTVSTRVLFADLAYDTPIMPVGVASSLARRFIECIGPKASFFTNGTLGLTHAGRWTPLTGATFDTGVVGVSGQRAGLLWVEDED